MKKILTFLLAVLMLVSGTVTSVCAADGDVFVFDEFKNYMDKEGMAFIDGGISDSSLWEEYEEVNKQKREFANENENNIYVDTIKAGLTYNFEPYESPDIAHYDSLSMIQLGHLLGEEIIKIL